MKTHTDLVNACLLLLSRYGLAWKNNTGATINQNGQLVRYGLKGSADLLACIQGRFVAVECKVGRDRQSSAQRNFEAATNRNGGIYILARSEEDVVEGLAAHGLLARCAA